MPSTTTLWRVEPAPGQGPPYHTISPDGTRHGEYDRLDVAVRRALEENGAIADAEIDEHVTTILPVLLALKDRGAVSLSVSYGGCSDEGSLEEVQVTGAHPTDEESSALEAYFEHVTERRYGAWEENDGAHGEYTVSIATESITVEHNHHIPVETYDTETHTSEVALSAPTGR